MIEPIRIEAIKDSFLFDGVLYKDTDGLGKICRIIMERDSSQERMVIYRGESMVMEVNIPERAKLALQESPSQSMRYIKYKPFIGIKEKSNG